MPFFKLFVKERYFTNTSHTKQEELKIVVFQNPFKQREFFQQFIDRDGMAMSSKLQGAVSKGEASTVKTLLSLKVKPTSFSLSIAILLGSDEIVELLLKAGVPKPIKPSELNNAIIHGHLKIVKLLVVAGIVSSEGDIQKARDWGHEEILTFLTARLKLE